MLSRDLPARSADAVWCTHCGLEVPQGLIDEGADAQFCCSGCRTAFTIIHGHGLARYYDLAERRDAPVRASGRTYEEFDHATFHELYVRPLADGLAQVDLYLEGVHCAACVWLVERVPLVVPGVLHAELNVRRSLAHVEWDPSAVPLSSIARTLDALGYPSHPFRGVKAEEMRRREDRGLLTRIGIAGAIAINVMLASLALYSGWFGGMEDQYARFFRWISLVLTVPAVLGPGRVFFRGAWAALRTRTLNMDVPIALGLAAGLARGAANTVFDSGPVYFDAVATLTFLLLVGRYIQQRGQRAAADSAELLHSLAPSIARVTENGATRVLPSEAVMPGMLVEVRPGEMFPADGVVEHGQSSVDASLLTGESRPAPAQPGTTAFAGTMNLSAVLQVRVTESGEASRLARILRDVEEGASRRAPVVITANRVAAWFVAIVLALAGLTFVLWSAIDPTRAFDNAIALLVVTCPCALALATPLAVSAAIGRAARTGMLIKGGNALELLARPGRLLLDKTGTITEARTTLESWQGPEWVKPLVLAVEAEVPHPVAEGFRRAWPDVAPARATDVHYTIGGGAEGIVDGGAVRVGSPSFVGTAFDTAGRHTPVLVSVDGSVVARAGFGDPIRADAAESIATLRERGWHVSIISGDDPRVVRSVAQSLGLDDSDAVGGATPEAKRARVQRESANGPVVMVGDGVNDAAAIAAAAVGIGVHGGAEACLASADVYLAEPGLAPLVRLTDGARRTLRVIRRNIAFALAYNVVGVALAMSGVLNPLVAALMMPAASLTVVIASWRSRTFADGAA